jgi:hypothetical protein
MAQEPDSLAFRFAVVLALAVIVLILATWAAPPHPGDDTATPIPHSDAIYRAQPASVFPQQYARARYGVLHNFGSHW